MVYVTPLTAERYVPSFPRFTSPKAQPALHQTALQVYCRNYKQATGQSHALLRKARRLDQLLNVRSDVSVSPPRDREAPVFNPDPSCDTCHTEFSPAFHLIDDTAQTYRCHRCYFGTQVNPVVNSVVHDAPPELLVN